MKVYNVTILHDKCYEDRFDNKVLVKNIAAIRSNKLLKGDTQTDDKLKKSEEELVISHPFNFTVTSMSREVLKDLLYPLRKSATK